MRILTLLSLPLLLSACAHQADRQAGGTSQERIYSYVDAQGNLIQGELPAHKAPTVKADAGQKQVRSYHYKDAQGNLVVGELPPKADTKQSAEVWQSADEAEADAKAKAEAQAHDRFVTYYDASGRLVREPVDPVTARAHQKELAAARNYQQIAAKAAQQSRDRQYVETMTAIPADCCVGLLAHAEPLKAGEEQVLTFVTGSYGWIQLAAAHPAHIYQLDSKARRLIVKSFKERGSYLHPYLLFLDAKGVPIMAVNNLFQRRYPESWYRFGYVEGSLLAPARASYVVAYLPYETGSRETGMVPFPEPTLVSEPDATPASTGQLTFMALPES